MLRLVLELIEHFRNLLVMMHADDDTPFPDLMATQTAVLQEQKNSTEPGQVLEIVKLLTDVETRIRHAISRRTLLELTLIRCSRAASVITIDRLIKDIHALREGLPSEPTPAVASPPEAAPPPPQQDKPPATATEKKTPEFTTDLLMANWHDLAERCGHMAPMATGFLLDAKPIALDAERLIVGFDPEFTSSFNQIRQGRNATAVTRTLTDFLGRSVRVQFELMEASSTLPGDMKFPEGDIALDEKRSRTRDEWLREPLVRQTLEVFDGVISDIRE